MTKQMNRIVAVLVLLVAATLETGGDALVRVSGSFMAGPLTPRLGTLAVSWECTWCSVFLMAQVLAIAIFGQWPDLGIWLGGALIFGGGAVIAMSAR